MYNKVIKEVGTVKAEKIKVMTLMDNKGFNQKQLANKANVSQSSLSGVLNGRNCRFSTARKIAGALGVDVSQIMKE